ncbi:MAG: peptide MFS transporter [Calditrichia bacterium]
MLKGHPKGLLVAFFANMGERFGFYTMMAILVYFLQAKYGLSGDNAGYIYSVFYFLIYALALVGGFIADRLRNYKGVIQIGIITMLVGYLLMAYPGSGLIVTIIGLFTIAFGNGLFKGNLQAVVGQLYDDPKYSHLRDSAYSVFYMGINIGAFFAPSAATGIRDWWLKTKGLGYDADLPSLAHQLLNGTLKDTSKFQQLANKVAGTTVMDLTAFAKHYIEVFSTGYNYAFGIAAIAMIVSLVIYVLFKSKLPDVKKHGEEGHQVVEMSKEEEKQRLIVLGLVFAVVIFFWMAFHQNGLTLTFFARDYTTKTVSAFSNMFFNIFSFLSVIATIMGIVFMVGKEKTTRTRIIGAVLFIVGGYLSYYFYNSFSDNNIIAPEKFQHFNPIFIVFLTPVVVAWFGWMNKKGKEPSTPRKIGIGMVLAGAAFVIMMIGSFGLKSQHELAGMPSPDRVSEYWLISTYFMLTIAELFLSPMGISFVSKVAPPRLQGLMQGGWLGATALGNQLLFVGSFMYSRLDIWMVWMMFTIFCLIAAGFIFSIMKKLEKVAV